MSKPVIQVENLSKAYQLGQIGTGTITQDIERFWTTKILGKEDSFLRIGETNDRATKGASNIVWSLKDLNFTINQGDAVGIIGKNGAGKSTLLKLLSRVTAPTTGQIKVKGRIASLLEVGTGFHPELSGRENIYLNGAILGMRKKEIDRKFDEIVDFSGVERYIDTPVKRYSSGMYVRLAFAVAAHLESEILIVDEVLAVGDAEFQKKCLGKMGDLSKGEGRTVLFVSHNMAAVKSLCNSSFVMKNGQIIFKGNTNEAVFSYIGTNRNRNSWFGEDGDDSVKLLNAEIYNNYNSINIKSAEEIHIKLKFEIGKKFNDIEIGVSIRSALGNPIIGLMFNDYNNLGKIYPGIYEVIFTIPPFSLATGDYEILFDLAIPNVRKFTTEISNLSFTIFSDNDYGNKFFLQNNASFNSVLRPNWFNCINKIE